MTRYLLLLIMPAVTLAAGRYTAEKATDHGVEVIHLKDANLGVEVSIVPSIGNRAYELKVHEKNLLYFPCAGSGGF